ncbi:MAG TPA: four helix bundle protein [Chloroflexi bacterium]|nr:MAG: hypothetical protein DRI46_00855 [Chloroflexota bacterium]HDD56188.1 four helix bundle protein [Chloroflexota bacterium]
MVRAATSITLNIEEGSTGQSNKEQAHFLSLAIRSSIETVACLDLIQRRQSISSDDLNTARKIGRTLFYKLTRSHKSIRN